MRMRRSSPTCKDRQQELCRGQSSSVLDELPAAKTDGWQQGCSHCREPPLPISGEVEALLTRQSSSSGVSSPGCLWMAHPTRMVTGDAL